MALFNLKSLKARIGLNTFYQICARFTTAVTGMLVIRLLTSAGYIDLDFFGSFQIVLTYVTVFWMLTDFGLNAVVVRDMAAQPKREFELFGSLITLRSLLGVIIAGVSLLALLFLPYPAETKWAIALGIFTILTQGVKGAVHGLFQVRLRYELQFIESLLGSIVYLGTLYWAISEHKSLIWLVFAFVLGQLAMMIVSVFLAHKIARFFFNLDLELLRKIAIATIPFGISLFFNLGNFKLDAFLLSVLPLNTYSNAEAVGIYNVAYKFFEFALITPTFLMNAVYPLMVTTLGRSLDEFKDLFKKIAIFLLTISVTGIFMTFLIGEWAISLIANLDEFKESVTVLKMLVSITPIFFISSLLMWTTLCFNQQKKLVRVYAIAFLTNLILNLIFIPKYGFYSAAITTGVSEVIILFMLSLEVKKHWYAYKDGSH